jgi:hypothetical protein
MGNYAGLKNSQAFKDWTPAGLFQKRDDLTTGVIKFIRKKSWDEEMTVCKKSP